MGSANESPANHLALQRLRRVDPNMDQYVRQLPIGGGVVDVRRAAHRDLRLFAPALSSAWPMDEAPPFEKLLRAIDETSGGSARDHAKRFDQRRR
jgi:hypothetical protein